MTFLRSSKTWLLVVLLLLIVVLFLQISFVPSDRLLYHNSVHHEDHHQQQIIQDLKHHWLIAPLGTPNNGESDNKQLETMKIPNVREIKMPKHIDAANKDKLKKQLININKHQDKNDEKEDESQVGQSTTVDTILNQTSNGFYIECGASTGDISNTIFFEKYRNWTGLLIEPTEEFEKLLQKKRHAWLLNACVSTTDKTEKAIFTMGPKGWGWSGLTSDLLHRNAKLAVQKQSKQVAIQCFPLSAILTALSVKTVDYFSLDVEGAEEAILNTIPFDQIHIKVFTIEFADGESKANDQARLDRLRDFFHSLGYTEWGVLGKGNVSPLGLDVVFYKF